MSSGFGENILVTGSNRGIGLAAVQLLVKNDGVKRVFAACRNPEKAEDLINLQKSNPSLHIIKLDIEDDESIEHAKTEVEKLLSNDPLDILINNAGVGEKGAILPNKPDRKIYHKQIGVNSISQVVVTDAFLPFLLKASENGKRAMVVNISSLMGSVQNAEALPNGPNREGIYYVAYSMSKAALNMYTRLLSKYYVDKKLIVVSFCPGWIRTDMGGPEADLSLDEAIPVLLDTISKLTLEDSGRYMDRFGNDINF